MCSSRFRLFAQQGSLVVLCHLALVVAAIAQPRYQAEIRRTSHGIPHITAKDYGSLGFGEGYAFAQDHLCSLADQVIKARGERAKYFGAGENNRHLYSDITMRALGIYEQAKAMLPTMSKEAREQIEGYVAGYNQYLREVTVNGVGGWCRGKEWVFPITAEDMLAYHQSVVFQTTGFAEMIATAQPPKNETAYAMSTSFPEFGLASNGWAIGSERAANGRGMLLSNSHYPWVGSNRYWEKHLIIPGKLDIYGIGLLGLPRMSGGFNRAIAWTPTVSAGKRMTFYTLNLVSGHPTKYLYDGKVREMTSKVIGVSVRQSDGTIKQIEHRVFFSHYGPILNYPSVGWSGQRTVTIRDANASNFSLFEQYMAMSRARNLDEFKRAIAKYNATPWTTLTVASAEGRAWVVDSSATPNLKPEAIVAWMQRRDSDALTKVAWERGQVLLDGSNSLFEWVNEPSTRPGIIPASRVPQLERKDFVFNANDSLWLANQRQLLSGIAPLQGGENTPLSLRTRMNALMLNDTSPTGPAGKDSKFTLDELAAAILSNRSLSAELLRGELVKRCQMTPSVMLDGQSIDLRPACQILAAWDGRYELNSVGPVLWREFITQYDLADLRRKGSLFAQAFNPADPVNTPHSLTPDQNHESLLKLARAVRLLTQQNIALDTPLGNVQYSTKNGGRIPMHGGEGAYDGIANFVNYAANGTTLEPETPPVKVPGSRFLTKDGYPVNRGTSFLMALEYTANGPRAQAFLTYSQSGDPASPLFYDQTQLFSEKKWRRILFTEAEIKSDPNLKTIKIKNTK
ncbi:MAG: penicillin acylase family protein [Blastocatellia bacterium]|nr:penicillin acylase family protein [Blastocatellia bacterium]